MEGLPTTQELTGSTMPELDAWVALRKASTCPTCKRQMGGYRGEGVYFCEACTPPASEPDGEVLATYEPFSWEQNPTCANCHQVVVAELGDTCANIPNWKRGAFTYCDNDGAVEILANGQPTGVIVSKADLAAGHAAYMAQPSKCAYCSYQDPQHATSCRNAGRPHPLCRACGEYNSHAATCTTRKGN